MRALVRVLCLLACLAVFAPVRAASPADDASVLVTVTGPAGATLLLDGAPAGELPLAAPLRVSPGPHELTATLAGMRPWRRRFVADEETSWRFHVPPLPLSRREAVLGSLLLAGSGQRYLGRHRLGWILTGAELTGALAGILGEISFQNHRDDYLTALADYRQAVNQEEIARLHRQVQDEYDRMDDARSLRDAGWTMAAAAVAISVLDAWLRFPRLEAGPGLIPPPAAAPGAEEEGPVRWTSGGQIRSPALHLGWRLAF